MPAVKSAQPMKMTTPLGPDALRVVELKGTEGISQLYYFELRLHAEHKSPGAAPEPQEVPFDRLLGQKISVAIEMPDDKVRHFHGICSWISQGECDRRGTDYRMEIVPQLWLLTRRAQSRIFQHESVPDILRKLFKGMEVDFSLDSGKYRPRDYLVQYRETDFHFASRIMEEEGIYYFFRHTDSGHVLVVSDSPLTHPNIAEPTEIVYENVEGSQLVEGRIYDWEKVQELRSGKHTLRDYSFERNSARFEVSQPLLESVRVGRVDHRLTVSDNGALEIYDYPGEYAQRFDGVQPGGADRSGSDAEHVDRIDEESRRTVQIRMQEEATAALLIRGASNCRHFQAGHLFTLTTLPDDHKAKLHKAEGGYLLVNIQHYAHSGEYRSGETGEFSYQNNFSCIPERLPCRPPRKTPKPVIQGTQTAVVVGPAGEEIFTDKYGRIKVQFHWDRQGKNNADSSCWVRVGTFWAGKQWGAIHIPRIGQEVIVAFEEGDPDQPIVVGSVYNAELMPPYKLPDKKTQSGVKSRSTLNGSADNFNELRFEDKKGEEDVYVHAEKDFHRVVENDDDLKVGHDQTIEIKNDRTEVVKEGNEKVTIEKGDRTVTVTKGKDTHTVKADRAVVVEEGNDTHQIKQGNREVKIDMGNDTLTISMGNQKTTLDLGKVETEAMQSIELKVGQSSIKIDQTGVTIKGMMVTVEGQIMTEIKAPMNTVKADGIMTVKGGVTMIN